MATPEFLELHRSGLGNLSWLATIALARADGTQTDTLYVSTREVLTGVNSLTGEPGRLFAALATAFSPVSMRTQFCGTDLPMATGGLTLELDRTVTFPAGVGPAITQTIRQSRATHAWMGARVMIYRSYAELLDAKHQQLILPGIVVDLEPDDDTLGLVLRQRTDWNRPVTQRYVNRQDHPRAPEDSVGLPAGGRVYGRITGPAMRRPNASAGWPAVCYDGIEQLRKPARTTKAIVVDSGRGVPTASPNADAKVLVASHALKSIVDSNAGTMVWLESDGGEMVRLEAPGGSLVNAATGSGILIPDGCNFARVAVPPRAFVPDTYAAKYAVHALEPNDVRYALLDQAANYRFLRTQMADVGKHGLPLTIRAILGYQSSATLTGCVLGPCLYGGSVLLPTNTAVHKTVPASTTPTLVAIDFAFGGWNGAASSYWWPDTPWDWGDQFCLQVLFDQTNAHGRGLPDSQQWLRIFFMGLSVNVVLDETLLEASRFTGQYRTVPRGPGQHWPYKMPVIEPAITEFRGKLFAAPQGRPDDGPTSVTGIPNSLIERAPDLLQHLLLDAGQEAAANIETGSGSGSFNVARQYLRWVDGSDLVYSLGISEETDVMTALSWLTSNALMQAHLSPYDDRWRLNVWRTPMTVDYPWALSRYDIMNPRGPKVGATPGPDLITGVRVSYAYDERTGAYAQEASISPTRSVAGYAFRNLRDQCLTVTAGVNDRLDFTPNGRPLQTATLTAGDYEPDTAIQHLRARMDAATGVDQNKYMVSYGALIILGYNDQIRVFDTASTFTVYVAAGYYATMGALATAVQTALNGAGIGGWSCRYSAGRFYIKNTHAGATLKVGTSQTDPERAQGALSALGYSFILGDRTLASGVELPSDDVRYEDHVSITGLYDAFDLNLQSGPNGADSVTAVRHCGDLIGFTSDADHEWRAMLNGSGQAHGSFCGFCPKGTRERLLTADVKRELPVEGRAIADTRSAVSLRNRLVDLLGVDRPPINFETRYLPDIQIGQVVQFRDDMDAWVPYAGYGSNGLWSDKGFVVIEYHHRPGPINDTTEIVAVEVPVIAGSSTTLGWNRGWGIDWLT